MAGVPPVGAQRSRGTGLACALQASQRCAVPGCSEPAFGEELGSECYSADNISRQPRRKAPPCSPSQTRAPGSSPHAKPASGTFRNGRVSTFPSGGDRRVRPWTDLRPQDASGPCRGSAGLAAPSPLGLFLFTGSCSMIRAVAIATTWKEAFFVYIT